VANDGWVARPVKAVSRRRRGPQARLYRACHQPYSATEVDGWQTRSMRKCSPRSGRHPQSHKTSSPPGCVHHARKSQVSRAVHRAPIVNPTALVPGAGKTAFQKPSAPSLWLRRDLGSSPLDVDEQLAPLLETAGGLSVQGKTTPRPRTGLSVSPASMAETAEGTRPDNSSSKKSRIKPGP
jgi:hypothetical protein